MYDSVDGWRSRLRKIASLLARPNYRCICNPLHNPKEQEQIKTKKIRRELYNILEDIPG